ncbi:hypothetical protein [uncultured Desulfobacter sp.]|uniref:hypothetical protein n=1 Tax=uncultured Desulfobacter sp. TaxID=240139 RepID=UPI002AAC0188|nr:hypothetical protein [uncultured Desulfobacter sp.]
MDIVSRYPKNPILTREDVPYPVATVHNAGVVKYKNSYIMLFRSHLKYPPGPSGFPIPPTWFTEGFTGHYEALVLSLG